MPRTKICRNLEEERLLRLKQVFELYREMRGKLEADCGVGELLLNLKGVKEDYNYDLECGIGEIRCADESYSGFGKDYTIDNHAAKNMEIECGIGQITVKYMNQM